MNINTYLIIAIILISLYMVSYRTYEKFSLSSINTISYHNPAPTYPFFRYLNDISILCDDINNIINPQSVPSNFIANNFYQKLDYSKLRISLLPTEILVISNDAWYNDKIINNINYIKNDIINALMYKNVNDNTNYASVNNLDKIPIRLAKYQSLQVLNINVTNWSLSNNVALTKYLNTTRSCKVHLNGNTKLGPLQSILNNIPLLHNKFIAALNHKTGTGRNIRYPIREKIRNADTLYYSQYINSNILKICQVFTLLALSFSGGIS